MSSQIWYDSSDSSSDSEHTDDSDENDSDENESDPIDKQMDVDKN